MTARRGLLSIAVLLAVAVSARAGETQLSSTGPTRFQFSRDPQSPIFAPGNGGSAAFETTPTRHASNHVYNEERQTDGEVLELYAAGYDFSPAGADAESTRPAGYWPRLAGTIEFNARNGVITDCRVTSALVTELQRTGVEWSQFFTRMASALRDGPGALLSIDLPEDKRWQVRDTAKATLPKMLVGLVCADGVQLKAAGRCDFAVVAEKAVPPQYGMQAAVGYVRSQVGQIPVIMQSVKPQIHKELVWLGTGAAAIQYAADLPPVNTAEHDIAWRNLRSVTAFPKRLGGSFRLAPELVQPGMFGGLIATNHTWCVFPLLNADVKLQVPTPPEDRPEYVGCWYNPITDENIYTPRLATPANGLLKLITPSPDPWVYIHNVLPKSGDNESSTTLIVPEPPEPEDDETTVTQ